MRRSSEKLAKVLNFDLCGLSLPIIPGKESTLGIIAIACMATRYEELGAKEVIEGPLTGIDGRDLDILRDFFSDLGDLENTFLDKDHAIGGMGDEFTPDKTKEDLPALNDGDDLYPKNTPNRFKTQPSPEEDASGEMPGWMK